MENFIYENIRTGKEIDLGSSWKAIFAEMAASGEKYLYRRTSDKPRVYRVE